MEQNTGHKITVEGINGAMVQLQRTFNLSLTTHHADKRWKMVALKSTKIAVLQSQKYIKRNWFFIAFTENSPYSLCRISSRAE